MIAEPKARPGLPDTSYPSAPGGTSVTEGSDRTALTGDAVAGAGSALSAGRMVVVISGNEGMLAVAAEHVTDHAVNTMARLARGLICVAMPAERLAALGIPPAPCTPGALPFSVSVEARHEVTSGISTADRARTARVLIDPRSRPGDLVMPGHTFPVGTEAGGVLARRAHPEALADLCRIAGLYPAAVFCGVMDLAGAMAEPAHLRRLARLLQAPVVTIDDIADYRLRTESVIERVTATRLPCTGGPWRAVAYRSLLDSAERIALVLGDVQTEAPVPVAVYVQDLIADVLASESSPLTRARRHIEATGRGVIIYELNGHPKAPCEDTARALGIIEQQILADLGVASPISGAEA